MTATQQPAAAELLEVDPRTLDVGKNVRDKVNLEETPGFVESVREHGVLHPITASRHEDGSLVVIDGQRRVFPRKWRCCVGVVGVSWRTDESHSRPRPVASAHRRGYRRRHGMGRRCRTAQSPDGIRRRANLDVRTRGHSALDSAESGSPTQRTLTPWGASRCRRRVPRSHSQFRSTVSASRRCGSGHFTL
ncbi:ParB/Srx family N-terminal domain-containing protein [Rhodococcus sp. 4CII]|uniref:ParB/Srx family N-terminal domain-containing protein n=1 Tax=Rhodococcus sp. 4CII TaxID=2834580 RepID=UPI0020791912|nr:ParB/Srx family N-terminal domain-containing protein [Rhodococcus sp. 4CII]